MNLSRTAVTGLTAGGGVAAVGTALALALSGPSAAAATSSSATGIVASGQVAFTANSSSGVPANDFLTGVSGLSRDTSTGEAEVDLDSATLFGVSPEATIRLSGVSATCEDGVTEVVLGSGTRAGSKALAGTYRKPTTISVTPTVRLTIAAGSTGSVTAVTAQLLGGSDVIQTFRIGAVSCVAAAATPSPTATATPTASPTSTSSPTRTPTEAPSPTSVPTSIPVAG